MNRIFPRHLFRRHLALPTEHGAWVFLLSPLLIGLFAGERWSPASLYLTIAALAAFLARHPITLVVKVWGGQRARRDLAPALFWAGVYTSVGLAALLGLVFQGFGYLLYLLLPGGLVFIWHLVLVSRRSERRQMGVEIVASGVLALSAPAAFWVGRGAYDPLGWWLWVLIWLQSAASIVFAYLRLRQRGLRSIPAARECLRLGGRALLYAGFNLLAVAGLAAAGILPPLLPIPYGLQFGESLLGTLRPAVGARPTSIGLRQLAVSSVFTLLFILTWGAW